jgi:phage gpG-like protein
MIVRDTISPALAALAGKARSTRPVVLAMATEMASIAGRSFRSERDRAAPWAPLRPSTLKAKGGAGGILRGPNANLARSFHPTATDTTGTVSTNRPYAGYHQFGTRPYVIKPKGKKALAGGGLPHPLKLVKHPGLPARPMLPFIGSTPSSAKLSPYGAERIRKAGQIALDKLLGGGTG